nr:putative amidase [uncultured bacterium]
MKPTSPLAHHSPERLGPLTRLNLLLVTLVALFLLAACGGEETPAPSFSLNPNANATHIHDIGLLDCPAMEQNFPRPEPTTSAKRTRDFSPFTDALDAFTPERAAELDALLANATILDMQTALERGDLTAVDLTTYYLDRIQRYDIDTFNAVLELNPDALNIAQTLDDERASGSVRGDMHGIPVLLKDNIATGDQLHTAAGAYALKEWQADRDAFLVAQLREAGAVILGKANLSEWANYMDPCMPSGFSALGGQVRNPYGPFEVWGSSSGSAVAATAGFAAVTVGSETQGSIIMPAGINSAVGLKTSRGLVSGDYIIPLLDWQDVAGPIGRTVTDVAVALTAMAGINPDDAQSQAAAVLDGTDFTNALDLDQARQLTVGVLIVTDEDVQQTIDDLGISEGNAESVKAALQEPNAARQALAAHLSDMGVTVVEVPSSAIPINLDVGPALEYGFRDALDPFLANAGGSMPVRSLADVIAVNEEDLANRAPYGQGYLTGSQNTAVTAEEYAQIREQHQAAAQTALDALFETHGIDALMGSQTQLYAPAGYPAITVPTGYAENGQPTNVVFIGPYLSEPNLLTIAYAFEQATQAWQPPDLDASRADIDALTNE